MLQVRLGVLTLLACLLAIAGGSAHAAKPKQAVFRVTMTSTLTKAWTFTRTEVEAGCTRTTRGVGRWETKISARTPARVRAIAAGSGKVRFSGAVIKTLAGSAIQTGTMRVVSTGQTPCERLSRSVRCGRQQRKFKGASSSLRSPRKGVLQLGSLRGARAARSFSSSCPEEPADIRAIRTDLPLATGPLAAEDVFGRDVPRFFITGDTEQETSLEGEINGTVNERVRWTLTFTRLPR